MGKTRKDNSNILQCISPSILLGLFLMVTLFNYSAEIKESNSAAVISTIEEQTAEISDYYVHEIDTMQKVVEVTAEYVGTRGQVIPEEDKDLLKTITKKIGAQDAFIIMNDGTVFNSVGEVPPIMKTLDEKVLLGGKTYISDIIKHPTIYRYQIVISAPIYVENQTIGAVAVVRTFDKLSNITSSAVYSGKNTYGSFISDGTVIEKSGNVSSLFGVGDNLFDYMEKVTFVKGSYKKLKKNIDAQRGGEVAFSTKPDITEASTYHLIYEPMGEYGGATFTLSMDVQVQKAIDEKQKITSDMLTKIIIALVIFVGILITINIINKAKFIKESKELKDKAETDQLTDLLNKIATEKRIREYLENEGKDKCSIMFVLDIDNFKKINDTMGHAFGDEVLSTLGRRIKSEFRINDIVGRTGGDEFVVFLKDMKDEDIMKREADRVATFFRDFKVGEYVKYSATASIGAAVFPIDASDYDSLYKAADQALYKAKRRGKNQLAFYRDEEDMT